ncbi:FliM/FliN family flagellar motor switch protein [Aestuariivirga sp.]|jgi:flagellar motor switch protein FliM|uniref:FliM/FliN family flagellar motor switch protein n=1 Tax=Aestuariivirga sp. TaxID=2650926 RepID=UPI00378329C5
MYIRSTGWSVVLDRIEDLAALQDDGLCRHVRVESDLGSLTLQIHFDRQAIAAITESALGGTGMESPFIFTERPVSAIENALVDHIATVLGNEITTELTNQFSRRFNVFRDKEAQMIAEDSSDLTQIRYVINIYTYSGEICLTFATKDFRQQLIEDNIDPFVLDTDEPRQDIQNELNKSEVDLTVTLKAETFCLEDIEKLQEGHCLQLTSTVTSPLTIACGSVASFRGTLARQGDRLAVLISSTSV